MKRFIQLCIFTVYLFLSFITSAFAQNVDGSTIQNSQNVDTTWVNHYTSGLLPGDSEHADMVTDDLGNVYVTGMVKIMGSGEDYITIKYNSSGIEQWTAIYNGPANSTDNATSIAVDGFGNVYVTGGSNGIDTGRDIATIKYNANGQEQWVVRYDGPGSEYNFDKGHDILLDQSGNVYVTGTSDSHPTSDYVTIKYNNEGVEQWLARYDGPASESEETAYYMALDASGNIYITGRSDNPGGKDDYATIKYNNDGVEQWVSRYNGPDSQTDQPSAIAVDDSGNVFVTGRSTNANYKWNYATVKYDSAGDEKWSARYTGAPNSNVRSEGLVVNDSGYVYVTGTGYNGTSKEDFTTIKYSPSGTEEWIVHYNGESNSSDKASVIDIDDSGNIYVGGQSWGSTVVKYTPSGSEVWTTNYPDIYMVVTLSLDKSGNVHITGNEYRDCATIKFNSSGTEEWAVPRTGPKLSNEQPFAMALDQAGNLFVAGRSQRPLTNSDYSLIKYNPDGVEQWVVAYNGPDSSSENIADIAVDISGNIYLTGTSDVSGGSDWATVKYNNDGVEQWVARFDGPGNYYDGASAVTVDGSGNVYVTGYVAPEQSFVNVDYATIKYDISGVEQWVSYYDGPGQASDQAKAITLDDSGNVYVTGISVGSAGNSDYATIKYNGDGVERWVARYNGPGNSDDVAVDIVVDKMRNVIVSGGSKGDGTNYDFATVQYNSAGVEQWVSRYDGSAHNWDFPEEMVINEQGDVFITGYGDGTNNDDFITIKYDNSGDQKWVSKYDGVAYGYDRSNSVALGDNGNIYVTGVSTGYSNTRDYVTIKINPEGYREWTMRYDAGYDQPADVVTDGLGHIYVTGDSVFDYDTEILCTTIKYTDPSATTIEYISSIIPGFFELKQNYPNPFNPVTAIGYQLSAVSYVNLSIYNALGQKIKTLVMSIKRPGNIRFFGMQVVLQPGYTFIESRQEILDN